MFYWIMKHIVAGPIFKALFRAWVIGHENIPKSGPVIIAGNHLSIIDSVLLPLYLDRRISFLAKNEYFTGKGFKGWVTKTFMTATGQLPIDRSGGKASEASLETGLRVLGRGEVLGIYPEGKRSPDARLYRGRTGIARMVLESGATIVPAVMVDTEKVMPIGQTLPSIRRIGIIIGEPLDFSRFSGMAGDRFILRSITDEVVYAIQQLSEQEYVDVYASTVRKPKPVDAR